MDLLRFLNEAISQASQSSLAYSPSVFDEFQEYFFDKFIETLSFKHFTYNLTVFCPMPYSTVRGHLVVSQAPVPRMTVTSID